LGSDRVASGLNNDREAYAKLGLSIGKDFAFECLLGRRSNGKKIIFSLVSNQLIAERFARALIMRGEDPETILKFNNSKPIVKAHNGSIIERFAKRELRELI